MTVLGSAMLCGGWGKRVGSPGVSLWGFCTLALEHLADITAARDSVMEAYELFSEAEYIRPVECDHAIISIRKLQEPVSGLCALLDERRHLPSTVVPLIYHVLVSLHCVNEQVCELTSVISAFRSICLESWTRTAEQQREIRRDMELLLEASGDIELQGRTLLHQVLFQERRGCDA